MLFALSRFVAMASERKLKAKLTCYAVDDPVNGVTVGSPTPRGEFREVKEYPGGPVSLDVDRSAVSRCFCRRSFDDHALPHSPRGASPIGSLPEDRSTRPLREFTVPFPLRDPFFAVSATFMQAETLSRKGSRPRHLLPYLALCPRRNRRQVLGSGIQLTSCTDSRSSLGSRSFHTRRSSISWCTSTCWNSYSVAGAVQCVTAMPMDAIHCKEGSIRADRSGTELNGD